jgi:hypothetical protein
MVVLWKHGLEEQADNLAIDVFVASLGAQTCSSKDVWRDDLAIVMRMLCGMSQALHGNKVVQNSDQLCVASHLLYKPILPHCVTVYEPLHICKHPGSLCKVNLLQCKRHGLFLLKNECKV